MKMIKILKQLFFVPFLDLLNMTDGGHRTIKTAGIWTTYPKGGVSHVTVFIDQVRIKCFSKSFNELIFSIEGESEEGVLFKFDKSLFYWV